MLLYPTLKRFRGKLRQAPQGRDANDRLKERRKRPNRCTGVDDFRCVRGQRRPTVDVAEEDGPYRARLSLIVMREELRLVGCHINADGALRLTGLAGQAEVQCLLHLLALPSSRNRFPAEHLKEQVSPAAGRMLLLTGHHVARTHGALVCLPALADAHAAKRGARNAALDRQRKKGAHPDPAGSLGAADYRWRRTDRRPCPDSSSRRDPRCV